MNTPNIRFKEFTDNWEKRKLGDVSEYNNGLGHEEYVQSEGKYELITLKSINTEGYLVPSGKYLSEEFETLKKDTLIMMLSEQAKGMLGMTTIIPCNNKYVLNQRVASLVPKDGINASFLTRAINIRQTYFEQMGAGTKVQNISKGNVENCDLLIPSVDEQSKIGHYFDNLDHLITLHQRKCDDLKEVKKYMLQKMFPKKGEKVPEIRFKGFTGDWEVRKLGDLCERVMRKNKNNESDLPLTIASQFGLIDQRDFFNRVVAAKDMSNYYLLKKGEFAYNKSYSQGYDYGSIKRLNAYEQGCLSTLYICFGITSDDVESDYLECYFDTLKWYNDVSMICAEGARNHGLLNVDTKAFFDDVRIEMPSSKEEQKKISNYLKNIDNQITLYQKKLDTLKDVKKFMLQNMFPN